MQRSAQVRPTLTSVVPSEKRRLEAVANEALDHRLPGVVLAIFCMHRFGNKWLNIWGFFLMAILFAAMAITYHVAPDASTLLFIEFMALTFALNFGPNVATYVLPAMAFPPQVSPTLSSGREKSLGSGRELSVGPQGQTTRTGKPSA